MPKRQGCAQSRWEDTTTWEHTQNVSELENITKISSSLEWKGVEFWGAIVGAGDLSTFWAIGPIRGWLKIHVHIDKKTKEKRGTNGGTEVPEEQRHLKNALGSTRKRRSKEGNRVV